MCSMSVGIAIGFTALVFALGFGYIISILSKKADKGMQPLGHFLGMTIMVLSAVMLIGILLLAVKYTLLRRAGGPMDECPMMKSRMMQQMPMPPAGK